MKLFAPVLIAIVALAANVTAATEPAPLPLSCFDSSVVSDLPMQNCADSQCDAGVFPEMVVWESVPASESIVFEAPSESMEMVAAPDMTYSYAAAGPTIVETYDAAGNMVAREVITVSNARQPRRPLLRIARAIARPLARFRERRRARLCARWCR